METWAIDLIGRGWAAFNDTWFLWWFILVIMLIELQLRKTESP